VILLKWRTCVLRDGKWWHLILCLAGLCKGLKRRRRYKMGTNYYVLVDAGEPMHIGKLSYRCPFLWQQHAGVTTAKDWLALLTMYRDFIEDEYGDSISLREFQDMVGYAQRYCGESYVECDYVDADGYHFITEDFLW